ncbi:MAG TPA: hypothetical protein VFJ19_21160 [Nocardioidaceae bacterium]|nr:hypothetical protein [Nocardioidaceae bacterium]
MINQPTEAAICGDALTEVQVIVIKKTREQSSDAALHIGRVQRQSTEGANEFFVEELEVVAGVVVNLVPVGDAAHMGTLVNPAQGRPSSLCLRCTG